MLSDSEKEKIVHCFKTLQAQVPYFKSRPTQRQMIAKVAQTFSAVSAEEAIKNPTERKQGEAIAVIEGPTGTGKSLAYLLPAVVMAKSKDKYLVVSSSTIALQEQLANKDIPLLSRQGNLEVTYAIAKGRSRYACNYRLYQHAGIPSQGQLEGIDELPVWERQPSLEEIQLLVKMADLFEARRLVGR